MLELIDVAGTRAKQDVYPEINRRWKGATRLLLGKEAGELSDYEEWLSELVPPIKHINSSISGKEVAFASYYQDGARVVAFDEVDFNRKFQPLSINEIKDIDSVIEALGERLCYAGGIVLGNSSFVDASANVNESHYVYRSQIITKSKYVAHTCIGRLNEDIFSGSLMGECRFCIRLAEGWQTARCLESSFIFHSSDIYFSHELYGCHDCMFSFFLWGKNFMIGNVELPKDKYGALKAKLVDEIGNELIRNKRLPSLSELLGVRGGKASQGRAMPKEGACPPQAEEGFGKTSQLMLGRKLSGIDAYSGWLERNLPHGTHAQSVISGKTTFVVDDFFGKVVSLDRIAKLDERESVWKASKPDKAGIEGLNLSNAGKILNKVAFFSPEYSEQTVNCIDCALAGHASNCYRANCAYHSKNCAYSFWTRDAEYAFGSSNLFMVNFCLKCYNSFQISRCLEVDSSSQCSDAYFLHNCENVHESMFCFNTKNKRNAIGNAELQKNDYSRIKGSLVSQMADEIEKKKKLSYDIFNIGER